ncbi:TRAP transporter substrate-binding protein [Litchfieldella xinjiangensis]|uniref:TRAP transporter substrate-binding protein n=1 Tax=Litchfieldella xinjiangensis TaxID=1166948 RepID=UPI0005BDC186|nr:TRAP transporter substrate-binding protein [Halomonas xinjiangensis]
MNRQQLTAALSMFVTFAAPHAFATELTAGHVNPPGEPSHEAFAQLAERLKDSETGISLTVFPQGQIGSEKDAIEQVRMGALTMTTVASSALSAFAPSVGVFDIPFLFRDQNDHPRAVGQSEIGDEIAERVEQEAGVEVLGWWSAGQRHVFTRETDVNTPEDLDGLKVRVIGSPVYLDTFNELGAQATGMPYGEVYSALANGTVDAAENDTSGYRNMKFWEQAPHLSLTGHFFLYKPVLANKQAMEGLTDDQRKEFDEIFREVTEAQWDMFASNFENDLDALRDQGVTIIEEPDREAFRNKVQPVIEKYEEEYGADLVERIRNVE